MNIQSNGRVERHEDGPRAGRHDPLEPGVQRPGGVRRARARRAPAWPGPGRGPLRRALPRGAGSGRSEELEPDVRSSTRQAPMRQQAARARRRPGGLDVHADPGLCGQGPAPVVLVADTTGDGRRGGADSRKATDDGPGAGGDRTRRWRGSWRRRDASAWRSTRREAAAWVAALEEEQAGGDIVVDVDTGIYGHRVSMLDFTPPTSPASGRSARSWASRTGRRRSARRSRCRGPPPRAASRPTRGTATSSSASTSPRPRARRPARSSPARCAPRPWPRRIGQRLAAVGGQVRQLPRRRRAQRLAGRGRRPDLLDRRRGGGRRDHDSRDGEPVARDVGGGRRDPGWCKLDWIVADPVRRGARERLEHARRHLGGAGRHDHPARRLRRPVLPGGLPRGGVAAAVREARQGAGRGLRGRLRGRSSTRWSSTRPKDPNWGKVARRLYNIFRLTGPLLGGRLPARAVRRAHDDPLPGRRADPHAQRRGPAGRATSTPRPDGPPDGRPDHGRDPGARRAERDGDGPAPARRPRQPPGARGGGRAERATWTT